MKFSCPYIGNCDPNLLIFFRGVATTNQSVMSKIGHKSFVCVGFLVLSKYMHTLVDSAKN